MSAEKLKIVPNEAAIGSDDMLSSISIRLPLVLVEDEIEGLHWFPGLMDEQAAARFAWFSFLSGTYVRSIPLEFILPPAGELKQASLDLDKLSADSVRVTLRGPMFD